MQCKVQWGKQKHCLHCWLHTCLLIYYSSEVIGQDNLNRPLVFYYLYREYVPSVSCRDFMELLVTVWIPQDHMKIVRCGCQHAKTRTSEVMPHNQNCNLYTSLILDLRSIRIPFKAVHASHMPMERSFKPQSIYCLPSHCQPILELSVDVAALPGHGQPHRALRPCRLLAPPHLNRPTTQ